MEATRSASVMAHSFSFDRYGRIVPTKAANSEARVFGGMAIMLPRSVQAGTTSLSATDCSAFNSSLELTILPTEKCDFKCPYCFEQFKLGRMEAPVVSGIKNLISNRAPELVQLNVMWYGGEPMLEYPLIVGVMEHVASVKGPALSVYSEMTTNGYNLSSEKFARLVGLGVQNYQITFDGDKEEHEKLRLSRSGRPTFDVIWANVTTPHETDLPFRIKVRLHVNRDNEASMISLLRRFAAEIGSDERYEFNVRTLMRLGGAHDADLPLLPAGSKSVETVADVARSLGFRISPRDPDYVCYASKPNSFLIRPNGVLLKCGVHLYDVTNSIGSVNPDGTLEIYANKALHWSRGMLTGNKLELACPARNFSDNVETDKAALRK